MPRKNGSGRSPAPAAEEAGARAAAAPAADPLAPVRPNARPRPAGPARSIFLTTVVDQVRPWLRPSSTLAATTQPHVGAQISISGTGSASSQPTTSTGLRPYRSESVPAA